MLTKCPSYKTIHTLSKCQKEAMEALRYMSPDVEAKHEKERDARAELVNAIHKMRDEWNPIKDPDEGRMKWCLEASRALNAVINFRAIQSKGLTWNKNAPKPKNYQDILDRLMNIARAARRVDFPTSTKSGGK